MLCAQEPSGEGVSHVFLCRGGLGGAGGLEGLSGAPCRRGPQEPRVVSSA